jgi:predicted GNAT superfamily acetyltransferase
VDPKDKKTVFENIGEILLFQCLQRSGQLEEFASSLFGSNIKSFLKNGYMIKEYHVGPDGETFTVTVHRINASHILLGVSEGDLAECLAVTEPAELKLKNVLHLGFQDALEQGYSVVSYKVHEGNTDVYSAQLKMDDKIKSFGR